MRRKSRVERRARTRIEVDDVFQESWAESSQCSSGLPSTLLWSLKWGALERERENVDKMTLRTNESSTGCLFLAVQNSSIGDLVTH